MVEPRGADTGTRGHAMTESGWSKREKEIVRRAFDAAYERECSAIAEEARKGMAGAHDAAGLWRVHDFLSKKRKEIDQKYDYRYSVLTRVFGILVGEGRLTRDDLAGLSEEKIAEIIRIAEIQ